MNEYKYDLHIHSCLSPCADDDMTPANIAGMGAVQGLGLMALTDHNTSKNCPAFFRHCKRYGIVPVAGMELTTAEEIHVLCLFPCLESALAFDKLVEGRRIHIPNRPEIFGNQIIMNDEDEPAGEEEDLLISATDISLEESYSLVAEMGGVSYPAHIDRDSGGIVAVLGTLPPTPEYTSFEMNRREMYGEYVERFPTLSDMRCIVSSDAHNLWSISDGQNSLSLEDEDEVRGYSSAFVAESLVKMLREKR